MEEGRGVHKVLVGKPEEKRPLGRPRPRWEDIIKMDLQEVGRGVWTGWRNGEMCTRCWWGNQKKRDHWGDKEDRKSVV
jgi:hypothetical protein